MNASTAQRILIAIGAFLAGGLLLLFVTGDAHAGDLARQLLVVAITVGGLFWLGYRFRVLPRRESFQGQAVAQAFHTQVGDPLRLLDQPFSLFGWAGSIRQIENTATGIHGDREMTIADYWFAPSGAAVFDDYERYTCVLTSATEECVRPDRRPRTLWLPAANRAGHRADQHGVRGVQSSLRGPGSRPEVRQRFRGCSDDAMAP